MTKNRSWSAALIVSFFATGAFAAEPTAPTVPDYSANLKDVDSLAAEATDKGVLVVDLQDGVDAAARTALGASLGIELTDNSPGVTGDGNVALATVSRTRFRELLEKLSSDSRVEAAEPVTLFQASFVPNDPKFAEQWHMKRVGAERAWEYSCGRGVTVAVIDTGVACYDSQGFARGTDLSGTRCVAGYNFVNDTDTAYDDHGHGTHVAGTIAQTTHNGVGAAGLAHCANLMPVKVLSGRGFGTNADVAEGIRWAADHGAQVINLSLGGPWSSKIIEKAVQYAQSNGVVIVAAAGNSGRSVGYPAAYPGVIAVSATNKDDGIAWFSSRGPQVVIGAPGVSVVQQTVCEGGKNHCEIFGVFNGTSMASPHVAGAAALLMSNGVTSPDAVRKYLESSATAKEEKELFGAGILNADNALIQAVAQRLLWRVSLLILGFGILARTIRKRGQTIAKSKIAWAGALLGGVGLVPFAPLLRLESLAGPLRVFAELLTRPIAEWDLAFGVGMHRWFALATVVPAIVLVATLFGVKRLRGFIGMFALGTGALCADLAIRGDVALAFGRFGGGMLLGASALFAMVLARLCLTESRD